ncbi:hypothetical protein MVEN_01133400 [Mycena venus]|uniref:Uncharacterized protein n=1 Tax=Mycena venus TaxID=2733690 RepID=A0A8H7CXR4_9AGAR|nr:hypothetical protein MVEN_01133400 [Mycena venus]
MRRSQGHHVPSIQWRAASHLVTSYTMQSIRVSFSRTFNFTSGSGATDSSTGYYPRAGFEELMPIVHSLVSAVCRICRPYADTASFQLQDASLCDTFVCRLHSRCQSLFNYSLSTRTITILVGRMHRRHCIVCVLRCERNAITSMHLSSAGTRQVLGRSSWPGVAHLWPCHRRHCVLEALITVSILCLVCYQ